MVVTIGIRKFGYQNLKKITNAMKMLCERLTSVQHNPLQGVVSIPKID